MRGLKLAKTLVVTATMMQVHFARNAALGSWKKLNGCAWRFLMWIR
jgi:hypothetical protein